MAYGAVVSIKHTIERLLTPAESKMHHLPNSEIEFISEELVNLGSFIETIRSLPSSKMVDAPLERRVQDAAIKLEHLIDSHLSDRFTSPSADDDHDTSLTLLLSQQLSKLRQEITSFSTTLESHDKYNRGDHHNLHHQQQMDSFGTVDPILSTAGKKETVGLDKQLEKLKEWVFVNELFKTRHFIFVVGMTGIGKTTLVEQLYNDPRVTQHFDFHLFLKIGPQYKSFREILLLVAQKMGLDYSDSDSFSTERLVLYLNRSLYLVPYLIVLDDVWSSRVLEDMRHDFPLGFNSRVIITTQILSLAPPMYENILELPLLDDDQSWKLLRETVFTSEEERWCQPQLEKIGKVIAKKCEGLPLAIIQVGELLSKTEKTVEEWEKIAEKEDPLIITRDDNTPLSKALFFSYRMLPQYLKVCFVYMGVFPKGYEIHRSKLIRLLVTEGFLGPQESQTSEETAGEYLDELACRSVVLSNELSSLSSVSMRTTKNCRLHFTFRSLCVHEAKSEMFFHVIRKYVDSFPENINDEQQRLCIHNNVVLGFKQVYEWMGSVKDVHSFLCFGPKQQYPVVLYLPFRLLKILDALTIRFYEFPDQVLELFHLKYLAITYDGDKLPNSIDRLWNLEVLIVRQHHRIRKSSSNAPQLPIEIWNLYKLKHLDCMGFDMPDPSKLDACLVLGKLLTLSGVTAHSCTGEVLARMPGLMKIGIKIESSHDSTENFSFMGDFASLYEEFESFKCIVINPPNLRRRSHHQVVLSKNPINFPECIRKISLSGCGLPWEYTRVIGGLVNLQVLKLRWYAFCGAEWRIYEDEEQFPSLEYLLLEDLDIERWVDEDFPFPELRHLVVRHCYKLHQFPGGFEFRESLQKIEVDDCGHSTVLSVEEIKKRRQTLLYDKLQVQIHSSWDDDK